MDVTAFFFSLLKFECSYLGLGYASDSFFRLVKSTDVVFRCVALIWFIRGFYFQHFWFFFFNLKILISLVKFYFHVAGVFICTAYFLTHLADFFLYITSVLHQDLDWSHLFGCIILLVNSTFEIISIVPILGPLNLIIEELSFGGVIFPCFL